eukprot:9233483-Pyramimonas_sp.AAC.1
MLPDVDGPDLETRETTGQTRERRIRESALEAITRATAVGKGNRVLHARTKVDVGGVFRLGDMINYHRPTATKDDHEDWNGPRRISEVNEEHGQL